MTISARHFHSFVLTICIFSLGLAFIVEYVMHLSACPLCISICALQNKNQDWFRWYLVFFSIAIFLAGYHTGVERGIFEMSSFCKPAISIPDNLNTIDFRKMLDSISAAQCDKPALVIFFLSMTEWNLLLNIFLFTLTIVIRLRTKEVSL